MKVLLLGGTGTLSTDILNLSLEKGYAVSIMNRGNHNSGITSDVSILIADFTDLDSVKQAIGKNTYDVVIDFLSRNRDDIQRLYPLFAQKCKQYIFISSACVYCRDKSINELKENTSKPNLLWDYNIKKHEAEKELIVLSEKESSCFTIIRPYITYNDERIPYGIAPDYRYHRTIIERIRSGKPMFVWDKGESICTLTHTSDFAKAVVGLFMNIKAKNEDFSIVSDFRYSWKEVLIMLYEKLQCKPFIVDIPSERIVAKLPEYRGILLGDRALNAIFNNEKIKQAVPGLNFEVSLEEGFERILKYYSNLKSYHYDYKFDAQIDRLIATECKYSKFNFLLYKNTNKKINCFLLYTFYRILSLRMANRLRRLFRL